MIDVQNLYKSFGHIRAVNGVSFRVGKGEILGFLGPNGAGKSTTMKIITGFLRPTSGVVRVCGFDIARESRQAKAKIGYLPEGAPAYPDMTPAQYLHFIADARGFKGADAKRAIARAVKEVELQAVLDQPIETLSKGFKRRVGLAQAILHDPEVLILDEPTDGLDPNQKMVVRRLIQHMSQEKAIIISTHILEEVEAVCSRAIIIDKGCVVVDGTPAELVRRSRYHNAVVLTLGFGHADTARESLPRLVGVAEVVEQDLGEGNIRFTAIPRAGYAIMEIVQDHARVENWEIKELFVEVGRLEEVFRSMTSPEDPGYGVEDAS